MKKLFFLLLVLTACSQSKDPDWKLVWSDEFNNPGLPDSENWGNGVGFIRNHELQYYTERRMENSVIHEGNLLLIAIKEPYDLSRLHISKPYNKRET